MTRKNIMTKASVNITQRQTNSWVF